MQLLYWIVGEWADSETVLSISAVLWATVRIHDDCMSISALLWVIVRIHFKHDDCNSFSALLWEIGRIHYVHKQSIKAEKSSWKASPIPYCTDRCKRNLSSGNRSPLVPKPLLGYPQPDPSILCISSHQMSRIKGSISNRTFFVITSPWYHDKRGIVTLL